MAAKSHGRTVTGRAEIDGGRMAVISISDSGHGIPTEKLSQVFDPFFTTKEQGVGIGLSIARTIILAHHGLISAENDVAVAGFPAYISGLRGAWIA
jgi:signal transduction histidine kinase